MNTIFRRLRLKNVAQTVAKSSRFASSDKEGFKRFYTVHSSRRLNGSAALRLNASQLEVLNVTFDPQSLPSNVDGDSYKKFFRQGRVYLVGTSHGDDGCVADVHRVMRRIRPDAIMVEVCTHREEDLHDADDDVCEFRAALLESKKLPKCRFVLGDRDIRITDKRAWNVIGASEIWRIARDVARLIRRGGARHVLVALRGSFEVVHDNKAKQRAHEVAVNQLFAEIFPEWWKANMTERDLYMTHVLHDALESLTQEKFIAARRESSNDVQHDPEPVRIVAVVGEDHMDGIKENWGKRLDAETIEELLRIPPNKWIPVVASTLVAVFVISFTTWLAVSIASRIANSC